MLTINVKFIANELTPGLISGDYNISGGSTVRDLLAECGSVCGHPVPEKNYGFIYPLFNGKPITLDSQINEDGTLHVCRVVIGG